MTSSWLNRASLGLDVTVEVEVVGREMGTDRHLQVGEIGLTESDTDGELLRGGRAGIPR